MAVVVRDLLRAGASALLLVAMIAVGGLVLWIGVPLGWLYVGSLVQGETGSLGAGLAVAAVGVLASITLIVPLLSWLSRKHSEVREARGLDVRGPVALEGIMAFSAAVAVIGFTVWFLLFAGTSPVPFQGR